MGQGQNLVGKAKAYQSKISLKLAFYTFSLYFCGLNKGKENFLAMYLNQEKKQELFSKHGIAKTKTDTGSPESQIGLFTFRINHLTDHLKGMRKDFSTQQGLLRLVGKRKKLLNYLQKTDITRYRAILSDLNLRK